MATIKLSALRDRRPKTEDIEVELPSGGKVKFLNPIKRQGAEGAEVLRKLQGADTDEDILGTFALLAENGEDDLQRFYDEDATLEDIIDVMKSVGEEIEKQTGSLGESTASR